MADAACPAASAELPTATALSPVADCVVVAVVQTVRLEVARGGRAGCRNWLEVDGVGCLGAGRDVRDLALLAGGADGDGVRAVGDRTLTQGDGTVSGRVRVVAYRN